MKGKHPVGEHILIAEKAIGRMLPKGAQVHHVNGDKKDNRNENLIVCNDAAYHKLLHTRTDALIACGNADWVRCIHCKQYEHPDRITSVSRSNGIKLYYHRICNNRKAKEYRQRIY